MQAPKTRLTLAAALLAAAAQGEVLYEKEGVALPSSVRMIHRAAAICQVLEESESPEGYEQTKANHGRPLHVWRQDYSALNGSGQPLSDLTAHFQIEAQWPPCTNWTGLGTYPGPVQWAGSFETIQRTGGMQPGEEAAATTYVLAFEGQPPRFGGAADDLPLWCRDLVSSTGRGLAVGLLGVASPGGAAGTGGSVADLHGNGGRRKVLAGVDKSARLLRLDGTFRDARAFQLDGRLRSGRAERIGNAEPDLALGLGRHWLA